MRIQRYIAKDMRSALGQVREAMGPEAVILSTGTIGDQVEVVAAIDVEVAREFAAPRGAAPLTQNETIEHMPLRRASSQLSEALAPKVTAAANRATRPRRKMTVRIALSFLQLGFGCTCLAVGG